MQSGGCGSTSSSLLSTELKPTRETFAFTMLASDKDSLLREHRIRKEQRKEEILCRTEGSGMIGL